MQARMMAGEPQAIAWNATSVELVAAANAHSVAFVVGCFAEACHEHSSTPFGPALCDLCRIYALHLLEAHAGDVLESGFVDAGHMELVRDAARGLLARIRPQAVTLVDAFDLSGATHSDA